jgi:hypothetical protein
MAFSAASVGMPLAPDYGLFQLSEIYVRVTEELLTGHRVPVRALGRIHGLSGLTRGKLDSMFQIERPWQLIAGAS